MAILRRNPVEHAFRPDRPKREIPPADYSDEITEDQIEAIRKEVGIDFEEWILVDGPAW